MPGPELTALVKRHGRTTISFQCLKPTMRHWVTGGAAIAYAEVGNAWIAAGNPLSPREQQEEIMTRFAHAAAQEGKRVRFFGAERDAPERSDWVWLKVGEQPIWNPQTWPRQQLGKRVRGQIRRALNNRIVTLREVAPQELTNRASAARRGLDGTITAWLATRRMAPLGFVANVDPYQLAEERRFFVAERDGEVLAALIAVPIYARSGWFIDGMPRRPSAPNGAVEVLFDFTMRRLAAEGSTHVSFGVCPLINVSSRLLISLRHALNDLYSFDGLHRFKAKLSPDAWQAVYVVHPAGDNILQVAIDVARVFMPEGATRFAWETLLRRCNSQVLPVDVRTGPIRRRGHLL